jgi:hypothetical protein
MPIEVDSEIRVLSENEFHALAHRVMGVVFDVHNDFGRLLEENLYQHMDNHDIEFRTLENTNGRMMGAEKAPG